MRAMQTGEPSIFSPKAWGTALSGDGTVDWRQDAACAELPPAEADRIFFADHAAYHEARVWCAGCPVRSECRAEARLHGEAYGFRGGETATVRLEHVS